MDDPAFQDAQIKSRVSNRSILEKIERISGNGSWQIDMASKSTSWSNQTYAIYGVHPEKYTPGITTWHELYHADDQKRVQEAFLNAIENQEDIDLEARIIAEGENICWIHVKGICEENELVGVLEDVTERKEFKQRALESDERYNLAVKGSSVGLWDWNVRTNALYWSPRFKEIVGIDDEHFVPHLTSFSDRLHPDDYDRIMDNLQDHIEKKLPYDVEYRLRREDGSYVWIHARGQAIWDKAGNPLRMAGSVDDIQLKKEAEIELADSRALLELMMEKNPDLLFVKDVNSIIVMANEAFLNIYPTKSRDSVIGSTTFEKYPEAEARRYLEQDQEAMRSGFTAQLNTITHPSGGSKTYLMQKIRFENARKEPFLLCIGRDITEAQNREKAMKEYNEALARSNKELDDFAYVASHDLKAPLRAIQNLASWIYDDANEVLPEDSQTHLLQLKQRAQRLESLLNDLLHFAKVGRTSNDVEHVETKELLVDIVDLLSPPDHVSITCADNLPALHTERPPLHQVFHNLIGNAIKHNTSPHVNVNISWVDRGPFIAFSVSDNGPGIPPKYHEQVFKLFQTLKPRDEVEGSGMGLAIVLKLVQHHGGEITVDSIEGDGTTFTFTWPKEPVEDVWVQSV